jgi:hypothetical protein
MTAKSFCGVAAATFMLVALVQLTRAALGWSLSNRRPRHSWLGELDRFRDRVRAELPGLQCCREELTRLRSLGLLSGGRHHWRSTAQS